MIIRPLTDLTLLHPLIAESEAEGHRFVRRYFDVPVALVLAAFDASSLLGVCGLDPDPYANDRNVGRVRHLYVRPGARRKGVGRLLVESIIARARDRYSLLTLRTDNAEADAFYRALGFTARSDLASTTHAFVLQERRTER